MTNSLSSLTFSYASFSPWRAGGLIPLIRAVLNSDRSFMRMLVEAGAEVNAFSVHSGLSALCWACRRGDLHMVRVFVL